ncbi:hypothetical protein CSC2_22040 [Clostridium zeae]|uniref:Uncharacterized protein n=1 Tax=Clostridium zeae TaxID=2759022 RepID=A0ABQ1EAB2_9CLOT|nr:hypothetical protein [Clostridium zeae]GFZ31678.1 hypothetical protein CSC2_22040 [Clostridium zeae]
MSNDNFNFDQNDLDDKKIPEEGVTIKHDKDGISIYINIYNVNNLANQGGNAGVKQAAETGGQISGKSGQNANQGGQIAEECGQNANQDGEVESEGCGCKASEDSTSEE